MRVVYEPVNSRDSIIVICPRCGEEGKLTRNGKRKVTELIIFRIDHKDHTCSIGTCTEAYDEILEIYKKYRGNGNE